MAAATGTVVPAAGCTRGGASAERGACGTGDAGGTGNGCILSMAASIWAGGEIGAVDGNAEKRCRWRRC
eukprot:7677940-Lingulodinium_polyedra.AAC.1